MNELQRILEREIEASGSISFARFMELALYHPDFGYYETGRAKVGRHGDFYTSVSVGPLFGELLGFRFAEWMVQLSIDSEKRRSELGSRSPGEQSRNSGSVARRAFQIVECGAHDGQLAFDILSWFQKARPELFGALEYWIIEPSPRRKDWQRSKLAVFDQKVRWAPNWEAVQARGVSGVIFSNELLDAFPVHRIGWSATERRWFEWRVAGQCGSFSWQRLPVESGGSESLNRVHEMSIPGALLEILPDGFTTEISLKAESWWQDASRALKCGWLLTFDYGLTTEELLSPQRSGGTLRAYRGHRITENPLANPGEQDLTAHIHFDSLRAVGENEGLQTEAFCTQSRLLTEIAAEALKPKNRFGDWSVSHTRQFQTLTHPEHLGHPFKALLQRR